MPTRAKLIAGIVTTAAAYPAWALSGWFIPTSPSDPVVLLALGLGLRLGISGMLLGGLALFIQGGFMGSESRGSTPNEND